MKLILSNFFYTLIFLFSLYDDFKRSNTFAVLYKLGSHKAHSLRCDLFFIAACSQDEENFKGNQQTCSQEREENYFADAENSSCMSSEDDSASLSDPDNWSETFNGWWFWFSFDWFPCFIIDPVVIKISAFEIQKKLLTWGKVSVMCHYGGLYKHFVYMYSVNCFTHTFHVGWDDQRQLFLVKSHILPLLGLLISIIPAYWLK